MKRAVIDPQKPSHFGFTVRNFVSSLEIGWLVSCRTNEPTNNNTPEIRLNGFVLVC